MPLKALDIYKLLPKKNCKECGEPTCLTFAMKLAQGKREAKACPYLDEKAKEMLQNETKPPVMKITVGTGEKAVDIGEEFVFYRHDKTFYHQPAIFYLVSDTSQESVFRETIKQVKENRLTRIGTDLMLDGIAVKAESGSAEKFAQAIKQVVKEELPVVLMASEPDIMKTGLLGSESSNPLIHAATEANYPAFAELAENFNVPLVVKAKEPEKLAELVKKCKEAGAEKLLLEPECENTGCFLRNSTLIRQMAVARTCNEFGYPVCSDVTNTKMAGIVTGIVKFASVIITPPLSVAEMNAALVLRQNIYTDPQKPIQMTPGLYRVGNPGRDAPVFVGVNFSLTYFTLHGYLESTRKPCFLLIVDSEGMSVLTAVAAGKLNEELVKEWVEKVELENEVNHRKLIIPGYASPLSGKIEECTGWKVLVGPRDAAWIGEFLEKEWE